MWYNSMYLCELHHRLKYSSIRFGVLYSLSRCPIRLVFIFTPSRRLQLLLPLQIISNLIDWVSHYAFLIFLCRFKKKLFIYFIIGAFLASQLSTCKYCHDIYLLEHKWIITFYKNVSKNKRLVGDCLTV